MNYLNKNNLRNKNFNILSHKLLYGRLINEKTNIFLLLAF